MAQSMDTNEHAHQSDRTVVEARQGITLGRMRYVLGISTALVVTAFVIIMALFYWPS